MKPKRWFNWESKNLSFTALDGIKECKKRRRKKQNLEMATKVLSCAYFKSGSY